MQKTPEYLAVNRWGVVPSLRHRGLTILQSNVILDYLARTTGHFEGATEQQRWQAREWLSWEADHITAVAKVRHSARFRKHRTTRSSPSSGRAPKRRCRLSTIPLRTGLSCSATLHDRRYRLLGPHGVHGRGRLRDRQLAAPRSLGRPLKAMPGFALPYDLIPSKDREYEPA